MNLTNLAKPQCLRNLAVVVGIGVAWAMSAPATAELIGYDPFLIGPSPSAGEYSPGILAGQNPAIPGFSGPWMGDDHHVVQAAPLPYPDVTGMGGSVTAVPDEFFPADGRVGRNLANPWDDSTNDTFYLSFLANFGTTEFGMGYRAVEYWQPGVNLNNPNPDPFLIMAVGYSEYGNFNPCLLNSCTPEEQFSQMDPATARLALRTDAPSAEITVLQDLPVYNDDGDTHLLVFKLVLSDQTNMDAVSLFVDPPSRVEPENAGATHTGLEFSLGTVGPVSQFSGGTSGIFDELRIGTTFADVVIPEPSSWLLALWAVVALPALGGRRGRV